MRVEIDSEETKKVTGTNSRGPWEIRSQMGYVDQGKRYPAEIKVRLKEGQAAYRPGTYEVDLMASSYVSKYGALSLSEELVLVPVVQAARPVASAK